MKKSHLNIKTKLIMILAVFVLISAGAIAYSLVNIKNQKSDALIINLAGRQRALVQAMSKSVLGLHNAVKEEDNEGRVDDYRKDIIGKKKLFNETLAGLMGGGAVTDGDGSKVTVPKTRDLNLMVKLEESKALWERFAAQADIVLAGYGNLKDRQVNGAIRYIEDNNAELFKDMNKLTMMYQGVSDTKLSHFRNVLYLGIALNLMTFAWVIWLINRLIMQRLSSLHEHMLDITSGEGDLTKRIDVESADEIGVLGAEFNALLENFEVIISKLIGSCGLLKESSGKLNNTFNTMENGINKQDRKTGQVATAMEEMSATVVEVARSASNMTDLARNAELAAKSGETSVSKVVTRMNEIAASTRRSVGIVSSLGEESQKIGNIVQVINEIADQTNLLALNAAIEAARAGDQGRGFAVVADEVRKLAERTTRSTKEIDEMISGIQAESRKAVESIENESTSVEEGVHLTREAGAALAEINASITEVTGMIQQIATSTEEQSAVAGTISSDMETVASVSKDSAAVVRDVSVLAQELNALAREIEGTLSKFKVSDRTAPVAEVIDYGSKRAAPLRQFRPASNG
ncbi:MAG: HAMP domain-containing protein [Deltaproteobacteria bacterium]|nr:HAMP domain-containing protein [Deltaproteobacteria bacterium]